MHRLPQFNMDGRAYLITAAALCIIIIGAIYIAVSPPDNFPEKTIIAVEEGTGLYQLAENLEEDGVIRSPFLFRAAAIVLGGERAMKAGQYYLPEPELAPVLAWRMLHGEYELKTFRLTIPEGFTARKISALFDERFPFFDNEAFETMAPEGYLFPDTYFVQESATATSTIKLLRDNFIRKIFPLMPDVEKSERTLDDIIIMASIIEGEAKDSESREIVSGILWKRYDMGMPLQVDASFVYLLGKATKDLTQEDLAVDSPYNTYTNKGLPPTPISNPGIESIRAALYPATTTPYLYFLTANDGTMHYSRTHDEHVAKKQMYLRN